MEKRKIVKVSTIFLLILLIVNIISIGVKANNENAQSNNETVISSDNWEKWQDEDYWEWHTRTTTDDRAYNGKHIQIHDDVIDFYGYWQNSYKDFLYKDYSNKGKKIFEFILDEQKANYHTLDGAGFIFNAKKENDKLSGYILLFTAQTVDLYELQDVDINTFENTANRRVSDYGLLIKSIPKTGATIHKLRVETSPNKLDVIENGQELMNVDLEEGPHLGESFGLISSYTQHACSILSNIEFYQLKIKVEDYKKPETKEDTNNVVENEADNNVTKQENLEEKTENKLIKGKNKEKQENKIISTQSQNKNSQLPQSTTKTESMVTNQKLPYAGNTVMQRAIILIAIVGASIFGFIKYREYKEL